MGVYYWQRRVYNRFSPKFETASPLTQYSDKYFEDYGICRPDEGTKLCLRTFGLRHSYPEYQDLHRISSRFHIYFVLEGTGYVNGTQIKGGNLILFDRNKPFNVSADPDDPFVFAWITFKGESAESYLDVIGLGQSHRIYRFDSFLQQVCSVFYDMLYTDHPTNSLPLYLEANLMYLLSLLVNIVPVSELNPIGSRCSNHVHDALEYLRKNYKRQDFQMGEVAESLGLNETYLRRLFRKEMKMSMREYLTDFRIKNAKELLIHSNYNISEISDFVGYRDYRQFYIQFKERTGVTPSEYSQQ